MFYGFIFLSTDFNRVMEISFVRFSYSTNEFCFMFLLLKSIKNLIRFKKLFFFQYNLFNYFRIIFNFIFSYISIYFCYRSYFEKFFFNCFINLTEQRKVYFKENFIENIFSNNFLRILISVSFMRLF